MPIKGTAVPQLNVPLILQNQSGISKGSQIETSSLINCFAVAGIAGDTCFMCHRSPTDIEYLGYDIEVALRRKTFPRGQLEAICIFRMEDGHHPEIQWSKGFGKDTYLNYVDRLKGQLERSNPHTPIFILQYESVFVEGTRELNPKRSQHASSAFVDPVNRVFRTSIQKHRLPSLQKASSAKPLSQNSSTLKVKVQPTQTTSPGDAKAMDNKRLLNATN